MALDAFPRRRGTARRSTHAEPPAAVLDADLLIPMVLRATSGAKCPACGGSGQHGALRGCRDCEGSGLAHRADWGTLRMWPVEVARTLAMRCLYLQPTLPGVDAVGGAR